MVPSHHPAGRPSSPNPSPRAAARAARLRQIRQQIRTGASAALDACQLVEGRDFVLATTLVDSAEQLLTRLAKLEKRAVAA
jgi:hypothetical protein